MLTPSLSPAAHTLVAARRAPRVIRAPAQVDQRRGAARLLGRGADRADRAVVVVARAREVACPVASQSGAAKVRERIDDLAGAAPLRGRLDDATAGVALLLGEVVGNARGPPARLLEGERPVAGHAAVGVVLRAIRLPAARVALGARLLRRHHAADGIAALLVIVVGNAGRPRTGSLVIKAGAIRHAAIGGQRIAERFAAAGVCERDGCGRRH
mmetsp:Transcript_72091/g.197388  ORF Transcript_72091/g.197388 Transcript_72091/m.197388 type:complete len:213 (-) Transcript_72091:65-703(-)